VRQSLKKVPSTEIIHDWVAKRKKSRGVRQRARLRIRPKGKRAETQGGKKRLAQTWVEATRRETSDSLKGGEKNCPHCW